MYGVVKEGYVGFVGYVIEYCEDVYLFKVNNWNGFGYCIGSKSYFDGFVFGFVWCVLWFGFICCFFLIEESVNDD